MTTTDEKLWLFIRLINKYCNPARGIVAEYVTPQAEQVAIVFDGGQGPFEDIVVMRH